MNEPKYSIRLVEPGVLEVRAHGVKYVLEAKEHSYYELTASKGDSVREHAVRRVKGNVVEVDISDGDRRRLTLKSTITAAEIRTEASLDGRRYRVKSAPDKHGVELARAFGNMTGPDARYIRWFMKDWRQHRAFREDVRFRLPGLPVMNGGPGTWACIAVCACCGFVVVDGPLAGPCCLACNLCLIE